MTRLGILLRYQYGDPGGSHPFNSGHGVGGGGAPWTRLKIFLNANLPPPISPKITPQRIFFPLLNNVSTVASTIYSLLSDSSSMGAQRGPDW